MNDYFTFFYVKHFELPLCMKCAVQINLPCLALPKDSQQNELKHFCKNVAWFATFKVRVYTGQNWTSHFYLRNVFNKLSVVYGERLGTRAS